MKSRLKYHHAGMQTTLMVLLLSAIPAYSESRIKPEPPPDNWTETNFVTAFSASVTSAGDPFDPALHGAMTPDGEICSNELNAAIYRQDVLHAFESKAHFDNCAFEDSVAYIQSFIEEANKKLALVPATRGGNDVPPELLEAMLNFGQALHAIQDFYAHSNYVELWQRTSPELTDEAEFPIVEFWTPAGEKRLSRLTKKGLVSGQVWWSFPHTCDTSVATHGELAKDSPDSPAGAHASNTKNSLTGLPLSNHTIAFNLASRSTREFLRWAGQRSPKIEQYCGETLRYIMQADRRAAD